MDFCFLPDSFVHPEIAVTAGLSPGPKAARMSFLRRDRPPRRINGDDPKDVGILCAMQGARTVQQNIAVRHGHLSETTRDKLKSRVDKLSRFFDRLMSIEVIVDLSDEQMPQVDIKVSAEHKHDFVAHGQADNLLSAVDGAVQKIEQQLRKYKERVQQRHRNPQARRQEMPAEGDSTDE